MLFGLGNQRSHQINEAIEAKGQNSKYLLWIIQKEPKTPSDRRDKPKGKGFCCVVARIPNWKKRKSTIFPFIRKSYVACFAIPPLFGSLGKKCVHDVGMLFRKWCGTPREEKQKRSKNKWTTAEESKKGMMIFVYFFSKLYVYCQI